MSPHESTLPQMVSPSVQPFLQARGHNKHTHNTHTDHAMYRLLQHQPSRLHVITGYKLVMYIFQSHVNVVS